VVLVFVEGPYSFRVDDQHFVGLSFVSDGEWLGPDPKAFSTGVDCGAYSEAARLAVLVEKDSVEKE